jgi:hypothetical protein
LCRCSSKLNSAEQWVFAFWVVRQGILADNVAKGRREGVACFFHLRKKVYTEETKPNSTNYHNIERQLSKKSNHPNLWKYSPNSHIQSKKKGTNSMSRALTIFRNKILCTK